MPRVGFETTTCFALDSAATLIVLPTPFFKQTNIANFLILPYIFPLKALPLRKHEIKHEITFKCS
jgi:hypothetical protein